MAVRGTGALGCGHWLLVMDSPDDDIPDEGPWTLWPVTMEITAGQLVTCMVCLTGQRIVTWMPGQRIPLTGAGKPAEHGRT